MASNSLTPDLASYWSAISRTLDALIEVGAELGDEGLNWTPPVPGGNCLFVLTMHTLGNAEENVVEILGGQPVHRNRDGEFSATTGTVADIQGRWDPLRSKLSATVLGLDRAVLEHVYDHPKRAGHSGRDILLQTMRHAAQHLGHAELTRDLYLASRATS